MFLDFDDLPDYEKKRLENIEAKKQFFNAKLQGTILALKAKPEKPKPFKCRNVQLGIRLNLACCDINVIIVKHAKKYSSI